MCLPLSIHYSILTMMCTEKSKIIICIIINHIYCTSILVSVSAIICCILSVIGRVEAGIMGQGVIWVT